MVRFLLTVCAYFCFSSHEVVASYWYGLDPAWRGETLPAAAFDASHVRLWVTHIAQSTYRLSYVIDLPNPVLIGELDPESNSTKKWTVLARLMRTHPNGIPYPETEYKSHVLSNDVCKGKQIPGRRFLQHCRLHGSFEVTAHWPDYVSVAPRLCGYQDQEVWINCIPMAEGLVSGIDPLIGSIGSYQIGEPVGKIHTPAKLESVSPSSVASSHFPNSIRKNNGVMVGPDPATTSQLNVVRLSLIGSVEDEMHVISYRAAALGWIPRFRIRYRYDGLSGTAPSDWIDAGPIVWDPNTSTLAVEIPRAYLSNAPCVEGTGGLRLCDRVDIELSTFDVGPFSSWGSDIPFHRFHEDEVSSSSPLSDVVSNSQGIIRSVNPENFKLGLEPLTVSFSKIEVSYPVVALAQEVFWQPELKGPYAGARLTGSQVDFKVRTVGVDLRGIDGFEIDMRYFQPAGMGGAWLRDPRFKHLDLPCVNQPPSRHCRTRGDESSAQFTRTISELQKYGSRWSWSAAETRGTTIGSYASRCYFQIPEQARTQAVKRRNPL